MPGGVEYEDELSSANFLCSLEAPDLPYFQPCEFSVKLDDSALNSLQKEELGNLLSDFSGLFAARISHTIVAVHRIETGDARLMNLPPYRTSPLKKKLIEEQIRSMLDNDITEAASGPWLSPIVIVPKTSGEARFCVDCRGLNQVTMKDRYPLPQIDESLDFLARGKFISTLDMARRVMNTVLSGLIYKCAIYLDDIVTASPTFKQHLVDLRVFTNLEEAGLTLKLGKCLFCRNELKFLGYKVSPDGFLPDTDKVDAMLKFPVPADVKHVRQFLGLASYDRRFIHNYAQHAEPLFAHKPGPQNTVPDALSRNPLDVDVTPIDVLPRYAVVAGLDLKSQPLIEHLTKSSFVIFRGKIQ
ncbi:hypothetical protein AOLI_G00269210 [Acnodon oligacanthus]